MRWVGAASAATRSRVTAPRCFAYFPCAVCSIAPTGWRRRARVLQSSTPPTVQVSCELLWRTDSFCDVIVVLGHNYNPVVQGAGSAVFLHILGEDLKPTNGGVALRKEDLLAILTAVHPCARLCVEKL